MYIINDYRIIEYLLFFLVGCSSFNSKKQVGHQKEFLSATKWAITKSSHHNKVEILSLLCRNFQAQDLCAATFTDIFFIWRNFHTGSLSL